MTLTLYSRYLNSAGERVRIALGLKQIPYEYVSIDSLGWDAWIALNPQGLVPAMRIGERVVAQSSAILEYLEETFPDVPLLPPDPVRRAEARGFAQHIVSEMHAVDVIRIRRFLHQELRVEKDGIDHWQRHWLAVGFAALEKHLKSRPEPWTFCFGETPGWADLHLVPQVRKGLSRFGLDLSPYPLIAAIHARCADLPAFVAATPEAQPDYPGALAEPDITSARPGMG